MRTTSCLLLLFASAAAAAEPAGRYTGELQHLEKTFYATEQFGDALWRESKRVADRSGPEIIPAILQYGRKWHGEEALIFVPLVALLPRSRTLAILHRMERSARSEERGFAQEFLTELDMPDTQSGVKRYSK
jgi:hypothetical protein